MIDCRNYFWVFRYFDILIREICSAKNKEFTPFIDLAPFPLLHCAFLNTQQWNTEKTTMSLYPFHTKCFSSELFKLSHQSVLKWAKRENIHPEELNQYQFFQYLPSSTGCIFSRIAQLRTLVWQLHQNECCISWAAMIRIDL